MSTANDGLYALLTLLLATGVAWLLLAQANYLYGFFHDHIGIAETIEQYGPQNRFKDGFETTDKAQRIELFSEIVQAVHNGGEGLEIIHLQDVARLIDATRFLTVAIALVWIVWTIAKIVRRVPFPSLSEQLGKVFVIAALIAILLAIFGFETVFYQFHIWLFPADHQWFFYYEDSLMSTMMQAPVLFAYIGGAIAALGITIFCATVTLLRYHSFKNQ